MEQLANGETNVKSLLSVPNMYNIGIHVNIYAMVKWSSESGLFSSL